MILEMSESSKNVFLESLNRPRITASHKFAIDVQSGLLQAARTKYKDVRDTGVKEGPFWVLVGAQMPSILIELGFISHPVESKRLYDKDYQQVLANGIANGIDSYFLKKKSLISDTNFFCIDFIFGSFFNEKNFTFEFSQERYSLFKVFPLKYLSIFSIFEEFTSQTQYLFFLDLSAQNTLQKFNIYRD